MISPLSPCLDLVTDKPTASFGVDGFKMGWDMFVYHLIYLVDHVFRGYAVMYTEIISLSCFHCNVQSAADNQPCRLADCACLIGLF